MGPYGADDPAYERALQRLAPEPGFSPTLAQEVGFKPQRVSDEDRAARGRPHDNGGIERESSNWGRDGAIICDAVDEDFPSFGGRGMEREGDCVESDIPVLTHPRSGWLRSSLADPVEDFKAIARVRDILEGRRASPRSRSSALSSITRGLTVS